MHLLCQLFLIFGIKWVCMERERGSTGTQTVLCFVPVTHFQDVVCCQLQSGSAWQLVCEVQTHQVYYKIFKGATSNSLHSGWYTNLYSLFPFHWVQTKVGQLYAQCLCHCRKGSNTFYAQVYFFTRGFIVFPKTKWCLFGFQLRELEKLNYAFFFSVKPKFV